ncbi:MAG TPA: hypothetical protein PK806_08560 [Saprospiraceae bacterium]|nr:hypothetical protein [Saprospiraceae bacterium]
MLLKYLGSPIFELQLHVDGTSDQNHYDQKIKKVTNRSKSPFLYLEKMNYFMSLLAGLASAEALFLAQQDPDLLSLEQEALLVQEALAVPEASEGLTFTNFASFEQYSTLL